MTLGRGCGALTLVCVCVCVCVGVSSSLVCLSDGRLNVCGCLCVFAALPRQRLPPLWAVGCGERLSHIDQFVTSHGVNIFGVNVAVCTIYLC